MRPRGAGAEAPRWLRALLAGIVLLGSAVPFLPSLRGEFLNWDDQVNLVANERFRGLGPDQLRWVFTTTLTGHWIPLTWLSFAANYALGGMNPWGYHLTNVLLHAGNALLFYFIARRLLAAATNGGSQGVEGGRAACWSGAVAALLFGVHPLRVESVAWVTERRDVLSGLFFLLAVLAYLKAVERGQGTRRGWMAVSLGAFAAGLLSKASVMVLPAVLLILDVYPLKRRTLGWRRLAVEKTAHIFLGVAGAFIALAALKHSGVVVTSYSSYGAAARAAMVAYSLWFYPSRWVWPENLSPLYELPERLDPLAGQFLGPLAGVTVTTAALLAVRRWWPGALAAWVYSAVMVAPVSGVVHAGFQLAHDRYSYLSGLGFALLPAGGVLWALRARYRERIGRATLGIVLSAAVATVTALSLTTWEQAKIWRDSESLWRWAATLDPNCAVCLTNLASTLMNSGPPTPAQVQEAGELVRRAAAMRPSYESAHTVLGGILAFRRRDREAEAEFRLAMALSPKPVAPVANLGALYARQGRYAEAIPLLRVAYSRKPDFPGLRANLGYALRNHGIDLAREGRLSEAIPLLAEAVGLLPHDAAALRAFGQALLAQGRPEEALVPLERAAALEPDHQVTRELLDRLRGGGGSGPPPPR